MSEKLFKVTLPWNPSDSEEGDYCNWTWARSEEKAVRQIAQEMAEHRDSGTRTKREREEYVDLLVEEAAPHATECIQDGILADAEQLLKGRNGSLTAAAREDLDTIKRIVSRYC